jgi:hypothetical protein
LFLEKYLIPVIDVWNHLERESYNMLASSVPSRWGDHIVVGRASRGHIERLWPVQERGHLGVFAWGKAASRLDIPGGGVLAGIILRCGV